MKKLVLVRHAKSSWDNPEWNDFERPLNKRGHRDNPFMAELIAEKKIIPDMIISSPAMRAITTAEEFARQLGYDNSKIKHDINIYEKGPKYITKMLSEQSDDTNIIYVFGHNPDLTFLSSYLTGEYFDNVPTCGVVGIEFDIDSWKNIEKDNGKLLFFEYPKKYLKKS